MVLLYFSIFDSLNVHDSKIMCKTGISKIPLNLTKLVVVIDTSTTLELNRTFKYLPDPIFDISNETLKAIERLVWIYLEYMIYIRGQVSDSEHFNKIKKYCSFEKIQIEQATFFKISTIILVFFITRSIIHFCIR